MNDPLTGFASPEWLWALWLAPIAVGALIYGFARQIAARRALAEPTLWKALNATPRKKSGAARAALLLIGAAMLVLGLARPQGERLVQPLETRGRDAIFVIDVSRSMLAEDATPNRLERAKRIAREGIEAMPGGRVALVAFAGSSAVRCPPTFDQAFFRLTLDELSPDSVAQGGTDLGGALNTAIDELIAKENAPFTDVILISDGENHQRSPIDAARRAGDMGARIITIGLGDPDVGATIPLSGEHGEQRSLTHEGEVVRSRLDERTLRRVADASRRGVHLAAQTGPFAFNEMYRRLLEQAERRRMAHSAGESRREFFQVALAGALLVLLVEALIGGRRAD